MRYKRWKECPDVLRWEGSRVYCHQGQSSSFQPIRGRRLRRIWSSVSLWFHRGHCRWFWRRRRGWTGVLGDVRESVAIGKNEGWTRGVWVMNSRGLQLGRMRGDWVWDGLWSGEGFEEEVMLGDWGNEGWLRGVLRNVMCNGVERGVKKGRVN